MENKVIQDRLALLRKKMQEEGIDFYMMPTADFHNSEYVNDYFKVREYFSNFTGSNGTLLVWKDGAGLWTDGRYFIQAEAELEGTGVELFRMLQEGVPTIEEFLEQNIQQGQTLGFDGRVIAAMDGKKYEKVLAKTQICIAYEKDLADSIWTDRPDFPAGKVTVLNEKIAGKSVEEKLNRDFIETATVPHRLTKLDDLMRALQHLGAAMWNATRWQCLMLILRRIPPHCLSSRKHWIRRCQNTLQHITSM